VNKVQFKSFKANGLEKIWNVTNLSLLEHELRKLFFTIDIFFTVQVTIEDISAKWTAVLSRVIRLFRKVEIYRLYL
jgi:hypothetical protein